jgi:hypothetical protein
MKPKQSRSEYWRKQLREAEVFPGTASAFCRARGLNVSAFYVWRRRMRSEGRQPTLSSAFVPVEVVREDRRAGLPDAKWLAEFIVHLQGARP